MKDCITLILVGMAARLTASASTPLPYAAHCLILNRAATAAPGQADQVVLGVLEQVALGRAANIAPEAEARLAVKAGTFKSDGFSAPEVRACALRSIGRMALSDAADFLASLTPADLGRDPSQMVWPSAQIALRDARLRRLADPDSRREFLERSVTEPHDSVSNFAVQLWGVNELCDRGALISLPIIQEVIRNAWPGRRGEEDIEFCEARIRVVTSDADRVRALGSALTIAARSDNISQRLVGWAVNQLGSIGSAAADAELDQFAGEIDRLPDGAPAKAALFTCRQAIRQLQSQRQR